MVPAAPGRFTTARGLGKYFLAASARARAVMSMAPPAGKTHMMVTGFSGYVAKTWVGAKNPTPMMRVKDIMNPKIPFFIFSSFPDEQDSKKITAEDAA
jgi:hypothetical protein